MGIISFLTGLLKSNLSAESTSEAKTSSNYNFSEVNNSEEFEINDELDENNFDENFDENEYNQNIEVSDDDLAELGELVDELIEDSEGELDDDDIEDLHEKAVECGLSIEEFDEMLENRLAELQDAIAAGYAPEVVYRTKSIWRRCPKCGSFNDADSVYCYWCGYQLRHKAVSTLLGALIASGAEGDKKQLHKNRVSKNAKKATKSKEIRKANAGKKVKTTAIKKSNVAAPKRSLISGKSNAPTSDTKKSLFGGKTKTSTTEKKKSLFGSSSSSSASSKSSKKSSLFGSSSKSSSKSKISGGLLGGGKKMGRRR